MSKSDFEYMLNKKIESGTLYHTAFATGRKICNNCNYRSPFTDTCKKFKCSIKRINQSNGGFHHEPCQECLEYKIQQIDINYIKQCYERRKSRKRATMTSEKNHISSNFNDFLKEENIEISEEEIRETLDIMFDKLCAKEGMKRCEPFIKIEESEDEK